MDPWNQMEKMKEERITNEEVRERFNNIPPAEYFIGKKILRFLVKTIRTSDNKIQKKVLNTWIPTTKKWSSPEDVQAQIR